MDSSANLRRLRVKVGREMQKNRRHVLELVHSTHTALQQQVVRAKKTGGGVGEDMRRSVDGERREGLELIVNNSFRIRGEVQLLRRLRIRHTAQIQVVPVDKPAWTLHHTQQSVRD
jgi:hypothetical protein